MISPTRSLRAFLFAVLVAWAPALSAAQSLYFYDHANAAVVSGGIEWNDRVFSFDPSTAAQQVFQDWNTPGIPWNHVHPSTNPQYSSNYLYTLDGNGRLVILDITAEAGGVGRVFFENRTSFPLASNSLIGAYLVPGGGGTGLNGQAYGGCFASGGGYLWVAMATNGTAAHSEFKIVRLDPSTATGSTPAAEVATSISLNPYVTIDHQPMVGMAYANGSLWIIELFGNGTFSERLWRIDVSSGTPVRSEGPRYVTLQGASTPTDACGMAFASNRLWVIDTNNRMYDFDPASIPINGDQTKPAAAHRFTLPWIGGVVGRTPIPAGLAAGPTNIGPLPVVSLSSSDASAVEGGIDNASYTITRSGDLTAPLTVRFAPTSGTATAGSDYSALATSVIIPAGSAAVSIPFQPLDDSTAEPTETVIIALTQDTAYSVGSPATVTLSLADNDTKPIVALSANTPASESSLKTGSVTVSLNTVVATPTVITMKPPLGSASEGADFVTLPTSVTIPANTLSVVVTVTPINDTVFEGIENFTWAIAASSAYTIGSPGSTTVQIADDDVATVTISSADANATEGGADNATVTFTRNGILTAPLTVKYASMGGTATSGSDYNLPGTSVVILAGSASVTVTVQPIDDTTAELPETVIVGAQSDPAYTIGSPTTVTLTIFDNEAPLVSVSASDASGKEGVTDNGRFTLTRLGLRTAALTVNLGRAGTATAGTDYTALSATVTIAAATNTTDVAVTVLDDTTTEADETVIVTVQAGSGYTPGATPSATVTIADNETPSVSISASDATAAEAGLATGAYTITRLGNKAVALSLNLVLSGSATNGTDYDAIAGTLALAANATSATVTVKPKDDTVMESAETVICTIASGSGYVVGTPANATVTITDDDTQTVTIMATDANAAEPSDTGTFVIRRSGQLANALTVTYSIATGTGRALNGTDFTTLSGTTTIAALATDSPAIAVTLIDDAAYEGPETVQLTITPNAALFVVGSPNTATVTIADNDKPTVTVSLVDSNAAEPSDTGKYRLTRNGILTLGSLVVKYTMSGRAINGTDYTLLSGTATIAQSSASVDVTLTPLPDELIEGVEAATLTIQADAANYNVGSPSVATVTIGSSAIDTIAGQGPLAYTPTPTTGGQATATGLGTPTGLAVDAAGNRFVVDGDANTVLKIDASGVISRFAGNASWTSGFAGDGGSAALASLNGPRGVAVDTAGNVYIADTNNQRVRKVTASTGVITTIVGRGAPRFSGDGGAATSAYLNNPQAVAVDAAGNIYIADMANQRVRKITVSTGVITTVVGNGTVGFAGDGAAATAAQINNPRSVAVDGSSNLYIADTNNNRIRKVTASTGVISTIAGNGTAGYAGDNGLATAAQINAPEGVAISEFGEVFIADTANNRVRKIEGTTILTVAGNGLEGWAGDGGAATSASLFQPVGLAFDSTGNLFVADSWNSSIRRLRAGISAIAQWRQGRAVDVLLALTWAPRPEPR